MLRTPLLRAAKRTLTLALLSAPLAALAMTETTPPDTQLLPEPGTWALVGIAIVAAITARGGNKRK